MTTHEATTETRPPSELVIEAVADHADVDPLDLDVPLGEVVDPDALDAIFASRFNAGRNEGRVEFTYLGYRVTVVSEHERVFVDVASAADADGDSTRSHQSA